MALVADIKQAFLNIEIDVSHRDFFDISAGREPFRKMRNYRRAVIRRNERLCTVWAIRQDFAKMLFLIFAII